MKWQKISEEEFFKKYSRKINKIIFKLPNGQESDFYIKKEGPACCIVAITSNNEVILTRQFRPGPNEILLELPGGFIDKEEDHIASAKRELLEETGYIGDLEFVTICLDDAYSTMQRYCFIARNCEKIQEPQNTESEICEVVLLSISEFRQHLQSGQMTDVEVGYLGLDYLNLL